MVFSREINIDFVVAGIRRLGHHLTLNCDEAQRPSCSSALFLACSIQCMVIGSSISYFDASQIVSDQLLTSLDHAWFEKKLEYSWVE